ncbi:MAG: DUF6140 family protein [Flavobacteriaceae bacterium]|jgi:hypothetical protein|nr:DUF6140 family protein [Flavobacteriaceae bacterium]
MALFRITVKSTRVANGIRIEKGMSVEVVSSSANPVSSNGGHQVIEAFERKYGIDIKRAGALNGSLLQVEKL